MAKIRTTLLVVLVVCAGCSSGEAVTVVSDNPSSPGGGSTGSLLQPVAVIGDGRATQASSATGTGGVVATTIGASVVSADAGTTALPTALAIAPAGDALYAAANGGLVALAGPANRQGRIAADNIFGHGARYRGTQGRC